MGEYICLIFPTSVSLFIFQISLLSLLQFCSVFWSADAMGYKSTGPEGHIWFGEDQLRLFEKLILSITDWGILKKTRISFNVFIHILNIS